MMTRAVVPCGGLIMGNGTPPCVLGAEIHLLQRGTSVRRNRAEMGERVDIRAIGRGAAFDHHRIGGRDQLVSDGSDDRDHLFYIAREQISSRQVIGLRTELSRQRVVLLAPSRLMSPARPLTYYLSDRGDLHPERFPEGQLLRMVSPRQHRR